MIMRTLLVKSIYLILNTVLADKVNKGYESINDLVLSKVNGNTVTSIKDLRVQIEKLADQGQEYVVFEFEPYQYKIILILKNRRNLQRELLALRLGS